MGVSVHGLHTPARYGQLAAFAWCHPDLRRMKSGLDQTAAADEYSGRCGPSARDIFQELSAIWHCLLLLTVFQYSPPRRGGVAAPSKECREATEAAQTGWSDRHNVSPN